MRMRSRNSPWLRMFFTPMDGDLDRGGRGAVPSGWNEGGGKIGRGVPPRAFIGPGGGAPVVWPGGGASWRPADDTVDGGKRGKTRVRDVHWCNATVKPKILAIMFNQKCLTKCLTKEFNKSVLPKRGGKCLTKEFFTLSRKLFHLGRKDFLQKRWDRRTYISYFNRFLYNRTHNDNI